ncbi:MAG: ArnT family glycosyltransferase [Chloroflexota bacterium]|nr:MAG: hypothetical protein DLM70_11850 [Chloroflexota bacterium]
MTRLRAWIVAHPEVALVAGILTAAAVVHAVNMFGCPYFEHDEGHRMSRAWSVLTAGKLSPYVWTYDETPLSYAQLAGWVLLTGGFHTFGAAIDSGRVFMLVLQVIATGCVYRVARTLSRSMVIGSLAALSFALSPFAVYLHRIVYEDNIATFWMLVSLLLLVTGRLSWKRAVLGAIALGLSILSKEPTVFMLPGFACIVQCRVDVTRPWRAAVGWAALVAGVVSTWVLYAALRGELLPSPAGPQHRNTLIGAALWQLGRARDGGLLDLSSLFWRTVQIWCRDEPVLVIGGTLGAILCILAMRWDQVAGRIGLTCFCYWAFLGRGGMVERYYLIDLIPLLAIELALACDLVVSIVIWYRRWQPALPQWLHERAIGELLRALSWLSLVALGHTMLGRFTSLVCRLLASAGGDDDQSKPSFWRWAAARNPRLLVAASCLAALTVVGYSRPSVNVPHFDLARDHFLLWHDQQTAGQRAALRWVQTHVPTDSRMVVESFAWTDLHDGAYQGRVWPHAFPHILAEHNPHIRFDVLHDDWRSIQYVVGGRAVINFAYRAAHPESIRGRALGTILQREALRHATIVAAFDNAAYPVWVFRVDPRS